MTIIKIEDAGNESRLLCPDCGGSGLHHGSVDVVNRTREDAVSGLNVLVDGTSFTAKDSLDGNPSPRRNGMNIQFHCEMCGKDSVLSLYQHKGETFLNF